MLLLLLLYEVMVVLLLHRLEHRCPSSELLCFWIIAVIRSQVPFVMLGSSKHAR